MNDPVPPNRGIRLPATAARPATPATAPRPYRVLASSRAPAQMPLFGSPRPVRKV